jgi:hypothetical protein
MSASRREAASVVNRMPKARLRAAQHAGEHLLPNAFYLEHFLA